MIISLFQYLLASSLCLMIFSAVYRLLISGLTHFSWMRIYLICSLVLSLTLPLINIPAPWRSELIPTESLINFVPKFLQQTESTSALNTLTNPITMFSESPVALLITYGLLMIYLLGCIYKAYFLAKNLKSIILFIRNNHKVKEANYWIVSLEGQIPAFSFFNYIFINRNFKDLLDKDLQIIKDHERVHADHYHTFDIMFLELIRVMFWFNPVFNYLKTALQEIHEYIADEKVAGEGENKKSYAMLLLNLASETRVFDLAAGFTGEHIKRRILMIAKPRTPARHKFRFFALAPLAAILMLLFSCSKNTPGKSDWADKCADCKKLEMKSYTGVYFPSKKDTFLRPMEILNSSNRLFRFIESAPFTPNRTVELQFVADNKFNYTDDSERSIEFVVDDKNVVTGCILRRPDGTFQLSKQRQWY
ncbi:MAG: M56 family metallopeptidase [Bacteroidetes bacterium]|nr:M56 family metallopeptidase [Bacteroidota bacterium]